MDSNYKHIVSEEDLVNHPEIFGETVLVGQEIELTDDQYKTMGLEIYTITPEDINSGGQYHNYGFVAGEKLERPILEVEDLEENQETENE